MRATSRYRYASIPSSHLQPAASPARELNRTVLSEMQRAEKKTRLRAEWTADGLTEHFLDYVPKGHSPVAPNSRARVNAPSRSRPQSATIVIFVSLRQNSPETPHPLDKASEAIKREKTQIQFLIGETQEPGNGLTH